MNFNTTPLSRKYLIAVFIAFFSLIAIIIRILPVFSGNTDPLSLVEMDDPLYHLRLVEQCIMNFPSYSWFDPMTSFPDGKIISWGPLFTVISSAACILLGATSRPDLITVCLYVPCAMGAGMVPVAYLLGYKMSDWKSGLIAGGLIAIFPGQFFLRSYYGYYDHHIAEVLFSSLFCLTYLYALMYSDNNQADWRSIKTWRIPGLLGLTCGLFFVLGLAVMPTMILFALIVGIFTPIWFIILRHRGDPGFSVVVVNSALFLTAIIGFFLIGVHGEGGLNYYTYGHPITYGLVLFWTFFLFMLSYVYQNRPAGQYLLTLIILFILGILIVSAISPDLSVYLQENARAFFLQDVHLQTIQEALPWSPGEAWETLGFGIFLFVIGFVILLCRLYLNPSPSDAFFLVWTIVILIATVQHMRYGYYLAVPASILGGIAIGTGLNLAAIGKGQVRNGKGDQIHNRNGNYHHLLPGVKKIFCGTVVILGMLFVFTSVSQDLSAGSFHLNQDWQEAAGWINQNTPDPGLDFLKIYNETEYRVPKSAYGIMSWWDYGHIILYLGKRLPVTNPFQYGVDGRFGAARFFLTPNESEATTILDKLQTKYIMTDYDMATGLFGAITKWDNPDTGSAPYLKKFNIRDPDNPDSLLNFTFFEEPYYQTLISRLQNFDGSMIDPENVYYIQYKAAQDAGTPYPFIVNGSMVSCSDGEALMKKNLAEPDPGYHGILVNYLYTDPISRVPSLQHFRLVHESQTRVSPPDIPDVRYVKVFEYVPGAVIQGEGIIEIPVMTNTGRKFIYRQESTNGTFTLPYPTNSTIGDMITTGLYKLDSTGKTLQISEDQIQNGTIAG